MSARSRTSRNKPNKAEEGSSRAKSLWKKVRNVSKFSRLLKRVTDTKKVESSSEIVEYLRKSFALIDEDGNGQISSEEIGDLFAGFGIQLEPDEIQDLVDSIDADGDGTIDFEEFVSKLESTMESDEDMMKGAFKELDQDGDDYITPKELAYVMSQLGETMEPSLIRTMIDNADFDGDGKVGYEDFKKLWQNGH